MKRYDEASYNDRLFDGSSRAKLHLARFVWINGIIDELNCSCDRVVELGCFDAKTIGYLPSQPKRYAGFDAGWEGGLDRARETWKANPNYTFQTCTKSSDVELDETFDIAICMETMEHLPDDQLDDYLRRLARVTKGYLLVTVPNEKGIVFGLKWLAKRATGDYLPYTLSEYWNALIGNCDKVARDEHKGFDYMRLVEKISRHFDVKSVSGLPFRKLPRSLGFTIAIVAASKNR